MCDYSLEGYRSRPAREGERYVTTRFASGTMGFSSPGDSSTPICVQCDTRLMLENISGELQGRLGIGPKEEVTFVRLEQSPFRDGVKFSNGKEVSLQQMQPGIGVTVTALLENAPRTARTTADMWLR